MDEGKSTRGRKKDDVGEGYGNHGVGGDGVMVLRGGKGVVVRNHEREYERSDAGDCEDEFEEFGVDVI